MTSWQQWKHGAHVCGVVGLALAMSYAMAGLFVFTVIMIVEQFTGPSIERHFHDLTLLLLIVVGPLFVGVMHQQMERDTNPN